MHTSCKSCTKNKAFLARYKNIVRLLQDKIIRIFLQDFIKILQENYLAIFLARFLQHFYILHEKLYFSAILARCVQHLVQNLASLARKILARFAYFLQDGFYWACLRILFYNYVELCVLFMWQNQTYLWLDLRKPSFHAQLEIFRNIDFNYLRYYNSGREVDAWMKFATILYLFIIYLSTSYMVNS